MPWYIVETTCFATVREHWRVYSPDTPPSMAEALARIDRAGSDVRFVDEAAEDEEDRKIASVDPQRLDEFADPDPDDQAEPDPE